jgi:hypothetical protein
MVLTYFAYPVILPAVLEFISEKENPAHQPTLPPASATVKLHALDHIKFTYTVKMLVAAASRLPNVTYCT